jgi:peptide/nickel transport system permease protein
MTNASNASAALLRKDRSSFSARLGSFWNSLRTSPVGLTGMIIVLVVVFCAIMGPAITPHDPDQHNLRARFQAPGYQDDTGTYWLGTDQLGRDILSRVIVGTRVSLIVGIAAVVIAGTIGVIYGMISGFAGGAVDAILMRVADGLLSIPFIILAVAISGVVGPSLMTLILVLGFTGWVTYARVTRAEVLVLRELDYVTAARLVGRRGPGVMFHHILPNILASAIVLAALQVSTTILAESSLSFLGLGVQPPTITWGVMLADGRQYVGAAWWMATFPGIAITITVLGVVFLGDWLRDAFDPRLRR